MALHRSTGSLALAGWLAAVVLLGACTSAPTGSAGGTPSPGAATAAPSGGALAAADAILRAVRLADPDSISALEGVRLTPAGTAAAAAILAAGATGDALWAATYVYASSGADPAILRPLVADAAASPSVRAMAAAALVGGGDVAGFDPLVVALGTPDAMDGTEPIGMVWEFAADVLERYAHAGLGPTLTASEGERSAAQTAWKGWLEAHRASLRFDVPTRLWVAP